MKRAGYCGFAAGAGAGAGASRWGWAVVKRVLERGGRQLWEWAVRGSVRLMMSPPTRRVEVTEKVVVVVVVRASESESAA